MGDPPALAPLGVVVEPPDVLDVDVVLWVDVTVVLVVVVPAPLPEDCEVLVVVGDVVDGVAGGVPEPCADDEPAPVPAPAVWLVALVVWDEEPFAPVLCDEDVDVDDDVVDGVPAPCVDDEPDPDPAPVVWGEDPLLCEGEPALDPEVDGSVDDGDDGSGSGVVT
jgi:hypothetical protein